MAQTLTAYPMRLSVDYPDRPLNRLTTFFRIFMIIPIFIILALLVGGDSQGSGAGGGWSWQYGAAGLTALPNVTWMEPVAVERYVALLKRARVVAVPLEPGPEAAGQQTVAIAQRVGTPVVCSDVPGVADYVEEGRAALLVPPSDPAALAAGIRRLWEDDDLRRRLTRAGSRAELGRVDLCREGYLRALTAAREAALGLQ